MNSESADALESSAEPPLTDHPSEQTRPLESRDQPTTDGRRLRRERGRAAAMEAVIDLMFEGDISPTAERIAARAGISTMSLYRYFDGLIDLRNETVAVWFARYPNLLEIDRIGVGRLSDRIARLVDARIRLYRTGEPFAHALRYRSYTDKGAEEVLALLHAGYVDQIERHFESELQRLSDDKASQMVAVMSTLTSFEAWVKLGGFHGCDDDEIHRSWSSALAALLDAE